MLSISSRSSLIEKLTENCKRELLGVDFLERKQQTARGVSRPPWSADCDCHDARAPVGVLQSDESLRAGWSLGTAGIRFFFGEKIVCGFLAKIKDASDLWGKSVIARRFSYWWRLWGAHSCSMGPSILSEFQCQKTRQKLASWCRLRVFIRFLWLKSTTCSCGLNVILSSTTLKTRC